MSGKIWECVGECPRMFWFCGKNCLDPWGTDSQCQVRLSWPVRNRLTLQRRIALTHKEQTHGARDFMNEFPWPTKNRLMERRILWMNFPDPQRTDSWSDGFYEWISLTHKEQTYGARDLMDENCLMTVLTHEDLAHGTKAGVNQLIDVFIGWKVYGLEWHSPPSFQCFIWSQ